METVSFELIRNMYHHINRIEKQVGLLANRQKWDRLTSALQVLEDSACAVEYYLGAEYPSEFKGKYLFTYGLLQALFIQGDAANSLSVALFDQKVDFKQNYPSAFSVREIRNDVVGHPTQRGPSSYIYLAQCSLSQQSFYYIKDDSVSGQSESVDVDVYSAINDMAVCVNTVLQNAIDTLDAEFREYIDKHRGRKMTEIFNMLHYAREKTLLDTPMAAWGYDSTKDMVKRCEDELILRYGSVDAVDSYKYLLEEIHELYTLIDDGIPQVPFDLQSRMQKYLLQLLFGKLDELKDYCAETDAYFENYGQEPVEETDDIKIVIVPDVEDYSK